MVYFGPITRTAKVRRFWGDLNNFIESLLILSNLINSHVCQHSLQCQSTAQYQVIFLSLI